MGYEYQYRPGDTGWTALLLHSTGGYSSELLDLIARIAPGTAFLCPRGNFQAPAGGRSFYLRRAAGGSFPGDSVHTAATDMSAFLEQAFVRHRRDPERLLMIGLSSGANVVLEMMATQSPRARACALLRPTYMNLDARPVDLGHMAVLLLTGDRDEHICAEQSRAIGTWLTNCGAELIVHHSRGLGHRLGSADAVRLAGWLRDVTAGRTP